MYQEHHHIVFTFNSKQSDTNVDDKNVTFNWAHFGHVQVSHGKQQIQTG